MKHNLSALVSQIKNVDGTLKSEANKAVNTLLTIRNWLIGYYIVEYEQKGEDRAKYGDKILDTLAERIGVDGFSYTNLKLFRQFFLVYPNLRHILAENSATRQFVIGQSATDQLQTVENQLDRIGQSLTGESYETQLAQRIINKLSFTHITLLLPLDNPLKRAFYAAEAIKGTWSVRELKRQINSLLFERSSMSAKPELLLEKLNQKVEKQSHTSFVKDIYTFEFLGLPAKDVVEENELEAALLDHLQQFLLEMGHGFCLEARQKRLLIGDEYFFIDLVFYHRVLKCHVLVELKVDAFQHGNASQLNTYINYYKKEIKLPDDNPPVGILLVTNKNDALVEYASAEMDKQLFVRKYLVELPDKNQLETFIRNELKHL